MTIENIVEIKNENTKPTQPIKEKQDKYIPDIVDKNISTRNGMIYVLSGAGGSGKSSLLLNMFKNPLQYKNKFHKIYYFCPFASFSSVVNHPFKDHDKVYHELTPNDLEVIYNELVAVKEEYERELLDPEYDEDPEVLYTAIIIDDFADALKEKHIAQQLSKMMIKARHLCCSFFITLQAFYYFPRLLRKQLTYLSVWRPRSFAEFETVAKELLEYKYDDSMKLFDYAFDADYNHLDMDLVDGTLYKNFNLLEIIDNRKKKSRKLK